MKSLKITAVLLIVGLFAASTSAVIIDPANITGIASSEWWQSGAVNVLYDGTGMVGNTNKHTGISYSGETYKTMWGVGDYPVVDSIQGINNGNQMMSYAILSFDKSYPLERINIWNVGGASYTLGAKEVYIEASNEVDPSGTWDWTEIFFGDLAQGPSSQRPTELHDKTDSFDAEEFSARHVAISIMDGYYAPLSGSRVYAFLSEVQFEIAGASTDFAGDFDGDGDVDGDDFLAWQNGFPTPSGAAKSGGDADGDGDTDGDDFLIWQNQFPSPGAVAVTPEPASLALMGLGGLLLTLRRR